MSGILQTLFGVLSGVIKDAYFNYVTLLLHGDGTNGTQNNTFLDSSTNNFSITRNGNATQGSFSPYGSNWSNYFNGTTDYLTVASNAVFSFGTSVDFTIELWVNTSSTANMALIDARPTLIAQPWALYTTATTGFPYFYNGTSYTSSVALTLNAWNHVAVSRSAGTLKIFVNGVQGYSAANTSNLTSGAIRIGGTSAGSDFEGYISNVRIINGTGLYTTAFTPPTEPLTAVTNTALLTCQSNRFIDNSSNAFSVTVSGTPSIQRFSPFSPSAAYSTSVIGGSGYFDGTGDYITAPANAAYAFGSGNFTIECWIYPTASLTNQNIIGTALTTTGDQWLFSSSATNKIRFTTYFTNTVLGTIVIKLNSWNHIVACRSSGTTSLYVNGVFDNSATDSTVYTNANVLGIGYSGDAYFPGYIGDVRILKGTALYTAAFTPPTAPLTAITNTVFLANTTNAGIFDNAMMNNLETVSSAQVSTSVVKFGTGSMSFNGSSSYLQGPVNPSYAFSTGDFTVEFWVYVTSYTVTATTVVRTAGTSGWVFQFDAASSNKMIFYANGVARLTDTASPSTGTWTYFAVVRSGSTLTMYRNGTSVATTTYATAINPTGVLLVGCGGDSNNASFGLNGYIDDLRITKGYARTITTPTASFPNQ